MNVYQLPYQSYTEVLYYIATQIVGDTIALGDFNTYYPNWMQGRLSNTRGVVLY